MKRIKTLITYDFGSEKMKKLEDLGCDLIIIHEKDEFPFKEIWDSEVLICNNPFQKIDLRKIEKLKWVHLVSAGLDRFPINRLREKELVLTNSRGCFSVPISEWIILKILEIIKKSKAFFYYQEEKEWKKERDLLELTGKKVLFLGTGSIAEETAKRLSLFGVEIIGINTSGKKRPNFLKCYNPSSLSFLLKKSDVVVVTLPFTQKTKNFLGAKELKVMKDNAILINISRGEVIDEEALIKELNKGRFLGVALDVFQNEPLHRENPFWDFNNVLVTPHNSYISDYSQERVFNLLNDNLERYIQGKKLKNIIDLKRGY